MVAQARILSKKYSYREQFLWDLNSAEILSENVFSSNLIKNALDTILFRQFLCLGYSKMLRLLQVMTMPPLAEDAEVPLGYVFNWKYVAYWESLIPFIWLTQPLGTRVGIPTRMYGVRIVLWQTLKASKIFRVGLPNIINAHLDFPSLNNGHVSAFFSFLFFFIRFTERTLPLIVFSKFILWTEMFFFWDL